LRKIIVVFLALGIAVAESTHAELSEQQRNALDQAFGILAERDDLEQAESVVMLLGDTGIQNADWETFFANRAATGTFTPALARFWDYLLRREGVDGDRCAYLSAACAASVLGQRLSTAQASLDLDACVASVSWLEQVGSRLPPAERAAVLGRIRAASDRKLLELVPLLDTPPDGDARRPWLAMQLCLTLDAYGPAGIEGESGLLSVVHPPEDVLRFRQEHGIFVFERGALDPAQWASLASLVAAIPPGLHEIAALVTPEALADDAPPLMTPGQVVTFEPTPMDQMSSPGEFIARVGQPIAPIFTLETAQRILRAIQEVQFARRPDLVVRRDGILFRSGPQRERYLRQSVPLGLYIDQPDELLPQAGFLWFIDSATTFRMAGNLLEIRQREAMDTFLLLADLLSNGGGTTILTATDPSGRVTSAETAIARTQVDRLAFQADYRSISNKVVPVNMAYVTGIDIDGAFWAFELNEVGSVFRYGRS